jgi:hypothetical protein
MASPQIAPASTQRVARAATTNPPVTHPAVRLARKGGAKPTRSASIQLRSRAQPIVLRGAHLHAPAYAGQPRGRQMVVLRLAHSRGGPGKKG